MTTFGMPLFLEDSTGDLSGSEFVDLYKRMSLSLRCTLRETQRTTYMIYNSFTGRVGLAPIACLDFAANNALGTIKIGAGEHVQMNQYLSKTSPLSRSKTRKFIASDGQEYRWSWRAVKDEEWTCTNASGYHVASYCLKLAGEPQYSQSSGCVLNVEEAYQSLAGEMLASLTIMRHIVKYNL